MKLNYLFRSPNNGHFSKYSTVISDTVFTQEKVTEWLSEIPGVERCGANIDNFVEILEKKGIKWGIFPCPCCDKPVTHLNENQVNDFIGKCATVGISWTILEGISGNY